MKVETDDVWSQRMLQAAGSLIIAHSALFTAVAAKILW